MTSRDIIRRVLDHDSPPRIGLTFSPFNGSPRTNDVFGIGPSPDPSFAAERWEDGEGGECWLDEWGCTWRRIAGRPDKGEVVKAPISSWDDLRTYTPPTLADRSRYEGAAKAREENPDRYCLGSVAACAFDRARYLRKLENYLADCAGDPEMVRRLNDLVSDIVIAQVDIYASLGADGVMFGEDWGTQERLLVSPPMWHAVFKPCFERLVSHAHAMGLTVWMRSCGWVKDIIPPLVDMGMDVFQFDQPELHGLDYLAQFADRTTYWCPVDIQTTLQSGDEDIIKARAKEMVDRLGRGGGFIGKDYPDNPSIGVDPLWQHWAYEAFVEAGSFAEPSE